jgi:hypothetical protein
MKTKKKTKFPNPKIKIDKSLNKYDNIELFPEKIKIATERLKWTGLPKMDDNK